jgi:hypothetical protein
MSQVLAPYASVIQVVVKGRLHGSETNNVLHFGTNKNPINIPALLAEIAVCIRNNLLPVLSDEFSITKLTGRQVWPAVLDEVELVPSQMVFTGLPALPSFVAVLFRLQTGGGGRSGKGRFFLPGVQANDTNKSILTSNGFNKFLPFITCMVAAFIRSIELGEQKDYELVVLSRKNAGANFVNAGTAVRAVQSINHSNILATMHSRKLGVGS